MHKIGLELHLKLAIKHKLFCNCLNLDTGVNTAYCEICTGQPGTMPILNTSAISMAAKAAVLFNMQLADIVKYDRKHYAYPDLPKGYQLTTFTTPIGTNGYLEIYKQYAILTKIPLSALILEEDPCSFTNNTLNYNRAGTALLELVTPPVFETVETVIAFIKTVLTLLDTAGLINQAHKTCFRSDVNISVNDGYKVEIKNVGSLEEIATVIPLELDRQYQTRPQQIETRQYNPLLNTTTLLRTKESTAQYLYLQEPNILPFTLLQHYDVYNVYENFKLLTLKYSLPATRLWGYAKRPAIAKFLLEQIANTTRLHIIDLMLKYTKTVDFVQLMNTTPELYKQKFSKSKAVPIATAYATCMSTDLHFRKLIQAKNIKDVAMAYVWGNLKKLGGYTYKEMYTYINQCMS